MNMNFALALPEIWLAVSGMSVLMLGAFTGKNSQNDSWARRIAILVMAILTFAIVLVSLTQPIANKDVAFGGQFLVDRFTNFTKSLVLFSSLAVIFMSLGQKTQERQMRFEFPILLLWATLGMMLMISANDFIALYVGLELQSLSLYVVAAIDRDRLKSTEAGLKYFVLGALASGMLLFGASLLYGFSGSTSFSGIASVFYGLDHAPNLGILLGMVLVCAGLAFKISAVPFHMWTPDVYEGAPTIVTAFFSAAPKVAAMALFVRVLIGPFRDLIGDWQQIVVVLAVASMVLGSFAAIAQNNIKRLMAYSSIGNVGFALIGLAAGTEKGIASLLLYLVIYVAMSLGAFSIILGMRRSGNSVESIVDLRGLARSQPWLAHIFAALLFSMAGIPPLAGFFGKLLVFNAAVDAGLYELAVIGVLASVVAAYYYVRIIKVMYFDEPMGAFDPMDGQLKTVLVLSVGIIVLGILFVDPIQSAAANAAASLFAG